jgi:phospholipase A-2-activating protein
MFSKHNHFVNCLAYLQPTNAQPNGLVVSAGNDKIIYTFDPMQPKDYVYKLEGHTDNICTLAISPSGEIISGSWDKTARVWKDGKCVAILKGHEFAVWGVLAIGNDVITASADKTIRVWRQGKEVSRLVGHEDVVRSLVEIPSLGFASCSNDASIRMWTLNGDCIRECYGHTSFVYSLAVLPTGEIVSSGEDRTVRVWQGSDQVQAIAQPCISVWAVAALPNGDIVAGGSDGIIRIFTRSEERIASKTEIEVFEAAIASSSIPSNQVGDLDKSKVAGVEALSVPGMKEGEVKMVKNSGMVEAYQWSHAQHQWVKIGEVVDAVGNSRKQVFGGQEYDYVFDVDIQEGAPPLKLPYNKGDNPYQAAQDFIHANEIPQDYLEQIADFIVKNVGDVTLGAMPSSQHVDPFTGAGRYVPGGTQPAPKPSPAISSSLIPMKQFAFIKAANTDAIINKIVQFNTELSKVLIVNVECFSWIECC